MFFCSRCGCEAALHAVCSQWAARDAAKRAAAAAAAAAAWRRSEAAHAAAQAHAQGGSAMRAKHLSALGLRPDASLAQAGAAYKRLALRYHPDKQTQRDAAAQAAASARFCRISTAWRELQ